MKIAVTGSEGRLGSVLVEKHGYCPIVCDITDRPKLFDTVSEINPDVIIHCAAMTNVDGCEKDPDKAFKTNMEGTRNVRDSFSGRMIFLSTVFVFDGERGHYSERDKLADLFKLGVYARTKWGSEQYLLMCRNRDYPKDTIIRASILFGSPKNNDPVSNILSGRITKESPKLILNPTYVSHMAGWIHQLIDMEEYPVILHLANSTKLSRYDFAQLVCKVFDFDPTRVVSDENTPYFIAPRPRNGDFNLTKALGMGFKLPTALQALKELKKDMETWKLP